MWDALVVFLGSYQIRRNIMDDEKKLAELYSLKIKTVAEELEKAKAALSNQEELEIASRTGSDKLKKCLVALRTSQKNLGQAIICRDRFVRNKSHRKFYKA